MKKHAQKNESVVKSVVKSKCHTIEKTIIVDGLISLPSLKKHKFCFASDFHMDK